MDVATIDSEFQALQQECDQSATTIQQLAQKMQAAAPDQNPNAREWLLDLKEIALQIQQEQLQTQALLQALHQFAVNNIPQAQAIPVQAVPVQAVAQPEPQQPARGGIMSHFSGGGFGQAMMSGVGMGAGFGLADSVINSIFD